MIFNEMGGGFWRFGFVWPGSLCKVRGALTGGGGAVGLVLVGYSLRSWVEMIFRLRCEILAVAVRGRMVDWMVVTCCYVYGYG